MEKVRFLYLDSLRGLAIIFVIVQHVSIAVLRNENVDSAWWVANIFISCSKPAVPLFFIVSGALLLTKKNILLSEFWLNRFKKVVIPFFIWIVIYYFWYLLVIRNHSFQLFEFIKEFAQGHSTSHLPVHLWFLPALISLYLVLPVLKRFLDNSTKEENVFFVFACVIFGTAIPFIHKFTGIHINYEGYIFSNSVLYFVFGYFLTKISPWKFSKIHIGFIYFVGLFVCLYGTYALKVSSGKLSSLWFAAHSPAVILMSISIFLIFKYCWPQDIKSKLGNIFPYIGKMSFGIYLIHIIWFQVFQFDMLNIKFWTNFAHPIISIPTITAIILLLSIISVHALQILPFGRVVLPK